MASANGPNTVAGAPGPAGPPGPPGPPAGLADPARAQIAAETARHYGNMRFTMFTVFTTIAGAFLLFPFTVGGSAFIAQSGLNHALLGSAGLTTSVLFTLSEYRISQLVMFYQERAFGDKAMAEPQHHGVWKWIVMAVMLCPPVIAAAFWVMYLTGQVVMPRVNGG